MASSFQWRVPPVRLRVTGLRCHSFICLASDGRGTVPHRDRGPRSEAALVGLAWLRDSTHEGGSRRSAARVSCGRRPRAHVRALVARARRLRPGALGRALGRVGARRRRGAVGLPFSAEPGRRPPEKNSDGRHCDELVDDLGIPSDSLNRFAPDQGREDSSGD